MQPTSNPFTIFGMSLEQGIAIAEKAPKGRLLETLTKEFKRQEDEREAKAKPATGKHPLIDRLVAGENLLGRVKPAPASRTPHSDRIAALSGAARATYFRANRQAIEREQRH